MYYYKKIEKIKCLNVLFNIFSNHNMSSQVQSIHCEMFSDASLFLNHEIEIIKAENSG